MLVKVISLLFSKQKSPYLSVWLEVLSFSQQIQLFSLLPMSVAALNNECGSHKVPYVAVKSYVIWSCTFSSCDEMTAWQS